MEARSNRNYFIACLTIAILHGSAGASWLLAQEENLEQVDVVEQEEQAIEDGVVIGESGEAGTEVPVVSGSEEPAGMEVADFEEAEVTGFGVSDAPEAPVGELGAPDPLPIEMARAMDDAGGLEEPVESDLAPQMRGAAGAGSAGSDRRSGDQESAEPDLDRNAFKKAMIKPSWQDGESGAAFGKMARELAVKNNVMGAGDAERRYQTKVEEHLAGLNKLRALYPNQEGFLKGGIWAYTPEQMEKAGVYIERKSGFPFDSKTYKVRR